SSNFAKFESQALHAPDKGQRFDVTLTILAKATLRPRRPRHQRIALVEPNRVNAQPHFFGGDADLHGIGSCREATPWSIVQSQHLLFVFCRTPLMATNRSSHGHRTNVDLVNSQFRRTLSRYCRFSWRLLVLVQEATTRR